MVDLIGNLTEMVELFTQAATADPLSALLILGGAFFVGGPMVVFAYLTLGAIADLFVPRTARRTPPQ
jgi:hypothetical protein